jgi:O-antigen ligase
MLFIPKNIFHLMFGIGFFEGTARIYPRTDSGYLKTLLSIGLPLGLLLYGWIFRLIFHIRRKDNLLGWLSISVILTFGILEIKEPFLYQNFSARLICLVAGGSIYLSNRAQVSICRST